MKIIFIAGPVRGDGSLESKRKNIESARVLIRECITQGIPFYSPHLNVDQESIEMIGDLGQFAWNLNAEMLRRSDALAVLPGFEDSVGTKKEISIATDSGKPVFYLPNDFAKIVSWLSES